MSPTKKSQKVRESIVAWAVNPVLFVEEVLGVTPDDWQKEALYTIAEDGGDRLAIASGHGTGKTTVLCWILLWWLCTRRPCKIACTANTANQLHDVLWTELNAWHKKMRAMSNEIEIKSDKVSIVNAPDSACHFRVSRRENPESLAGFHSPSMMFIIDEASGIPDIIFETAQGALSTEGSKVIMTGNPTRSQGFFYDAFHKNADRWNLMNISCYDSPRVSPEFIEDMARQYGEESAVFSYRVLGKFPQMDDDTVINRRLAEAAVTRDVQPSEVAPVIWGLDPARSAARDRTALCKRRGNAVLEVISWRNLDLMETAGRVKAEFDNARWDTRCSELCVDSIGIGAGLADRLAELGLPVRAVNVAESSAMADRFVRLRDELWWSAREWLEQRDCTLPDDDNLITELCLPRFTYTSAGKIKIESKDDSKKRFGGKSPDLADAFVLTFASAPMAVAGGSSFRWSQPLEYSDLGIV